MGSNPIALTNAINKLWQDSATQNEIVKYQGSPKGNEAPRRPVFRAIAPRICHGRPAARHCQGASLGSGPAGFRAAVAPLTASAATILRLGAARKNRITPGGTRF